MKVKEFLNQALTIFGMTSPRVRRDVGNHVQYPLQRPPGPDPAILARVFAHHHQPGMNANAEISIAFERGNQCQT